MKRRPKHPSTVAAEQTVAGKTFNAVMASEQVKQAAQSAKHTAESHQDDTQPKQKNCRERHSGRGVLRAINKHRGGIAAGIALLAFGGAYENSQFQAFGDKITILDSQETKNLKRAQAVGASCVNRVITLPSGTPYYSEPTTFSDALPVIPGLWSRHKSNQAGMVPAGKQLTISAALVYAPDPAWKGFKLAGAPREDGLGRSIDWVNTETPPKKPVTYSFADHPEATSLNNTCHISPAGAITFDSHPAGLATISSAKEQALFRQQYHVSK